jgi:divalent metal cation (Fe/Co/Zn/Cd) transporter
MEISTRKINAILFVAALAAAWLVGGPVLAVALALTIAGYVFVRAMQTAREEIRRIQMDERPDLYSRNCSPGWNNSAY